MKDISLHILDLVQNSIAAGATLIKITIQDIPQDGLIIVEICDNGSGMDKEQVKQVSDPFYTTRTTRKVGLGIPLFKASAEATGGQFEISSQKGSGTTIRAVFHSSHIDCLPIGSMEDTMAVLIFCNPNVDFIYTHEYSDSQFLLSTEEIRQYLGNLDIFHPDVIAWIKEYISQGLEEIYGGVSK
jgi:anti-sigma regulatory factor (Ser/Thr protein kinase)